jgi:hypothetical protein
VTREIPYIAVFGSVRPTEGRPEYEEARRLGALLAQAGFGLINGGYEGTMEASARGAREAGAPAPTLGVTVRSIGRPPNRWIDEEIRADTLMDRLRILLSRPAGYVALKGGSGTLAEIALAWELNNKGQFETEKPLALLGDFWTPLVELIDREDTASRHGPAARCVFVAPTAERAVEILAEKIRPG